MTLKFAEKNNGGIELHLSFEERKLVYNALRHYSVYSDSKASMVTVVPKVCELMNILYVPEEFMKGVD